MEIEKFFEMRDQIKKEYEDAINKNQELYDSGERDLSKFNKEYMKVELYARIKLQDMALSSMIDYLKDFNEKLDDDIIVCDSDPRYGIEVYSCDDTEDAWVREEGISIHHYVPKEYNERFWKSEVKEAFTKILKPEGETYTRHIDCKLMELYKDGTIDFKALQKLVYTDCEV